ncbi:ABC transporter permease [Croceibacterium mercuriale]|uniref:ABC transporter permease n=1 Tax=Croceibacterium mercuriale TaxID=1572751 RepID=A0A0B2BUA5_9SPHN|nr:ABC transporter permease [Croceibacterium mercuriale]KHL25019.1 ABC transporter permease [Croceibacterium mercuriale]
MFGLAVAYLRDRALTTLLNVLLLALAVATLAILLLFSSQIGNRFERDAAGVELVVGAKGSPLQLILSSLYQVDAPTGNIPLESLALLRGNRAVAQAIPLALGDQFQGFRIVGTEPAYAELYGAGIAEGRMFADHQEAVIGAEVARATGMGLGQRFVGSHGLSAGGTEHAHAPFMAVGILQPTGTVIDRLVLVDVPSVWDAHGIQHEEEATHDAHEDHADEESHEAHGGQSGMAPEITAVLVKYRSAFGAVSVPGIINRQTDLQAAVPAVETARLLGLLGAGVDGARIFAWLLAATGGLSIFVALLQAANAREGELALLRVMGASRAQLFGTIVIEALLIAVAGCAVGLAVGHGVLALAIGSFDTLREVGISASVLHPGELAIVAAVLGIALLAALIPAARVARTDLAVTLARAR